MKQWHPLFAHLLRPLLEGYYEVQTNVPVGDAPREADIVLLRRTFSGALPFRGLWKHLTTWNILEFKGPTVSPRIRDLDLLVELGLGIDRRMNEERLEAKQPALRPDDVSFWYLASHLGARFLREGKARLVGLEPVSPGVWCCTLLQRMVFLISSGDLPVEHDSLPLHLVGQASPETEMVMAEVIQEDAGLLEAYARWLIARYPKIWNEVNAMSRTAKKGFEFDFAGLVRQMGWEEFSRHFDMKLFIKEVGLKPIIDAAGHKRMIKDLVDQLTPEERLELKRQLN